MGRHPRRPQVTPCAKVYAHRVSIQGGASMWREHMGVPNQPKTPGRAVRVPDETWDPARESAKRRGETLSNIMRDSLDGFNIMTDEQWADLIDVALRLDISRPELFSTAIIEWVERHK